MPDNDLIQGIVPADLIPPSVSKEIFASTQSTTSTMSSGSFNNAGIEQQFGAPSIELPSIGKLKSQIGRDKMAHYSMQL